MLSFVVDQITNSIVNAVSGEILETEVRPLVKEDLKSILKKDGWKFKWKMEFLTTKGKIYKLVLEGDDEIQGLISIEKMAGFYEMNLIETAPHNFGASKKYIGVPGNLVAFACKESYDAGFEGFVGFRPKTNLIKHYIKELGAELIPGKRMQIATKSAEKLVNSYFKKHRYGRKK